MKVKLITAVLLAAAIVTIGIVRSASTLQEKSPPSKDRIQWYAKEAKAKGQKKVTIPGNLPEYLGSAGTISAEEAFLSSTVVVAHVVSKESFYRDNDVFTWNKFVIDEVLSEARDFPGSRASLPAPPSTLLPLQSGEFLIPKSGGTVNIDGVAIDQIVESFPPYELNQKYVLLINLYPSGIARTFGGPVGVFKVLENDKLAPIGESDHKTRRDFKDLYGNSLVFLRKSLKSK